MEGVCCAKEDCSRESLQWATMHFGGASLGDIRRSRRLVKAAAAMSENPRMSLPKQFPEWSDLTAVYRLFSNDTIDPQAILAPHKALIRGEAASHPVVLCVQDDTQLDFTCRTGITGLGMTGNGGGRGLLQHGAIAVLPDKCVLGVLDLAWHAVERVKPGQTRRERQAQWNVSDVWQEAATSIGPWPEGSGLIHVGDRHADLFRFMHQALLLGHGFVVRAMHDRYSDERPRHLWDKLLAQESLGEFTVTLGEQRDRGNRIKRQGREARLTIRASPLLVPPPCKDPRTSGFASLSLWAVHVKEEHPPESQEPVEWMLVTSLETRTLEQALVIIGYYTCRWVIEQWHRCMKEGCRIEKSQLDEVSDIQRLAAVMAVQAIRLLKMRDLADSTESESPEALGKVVPRLHILIVAGLAKVEPEKLTPHLFWRTIAKRGGWLGRKHDHRPGWIVLWRGWTDIVQMVRGAELYQQLTQSQT